MLDKQIGRDFRDVSQSSERLNVEVKLEGDNNNSNENLEIQSSSTDSKVKSEGHGQSRDNKAEDAEKASEAVSINNGEKSHEATADGGQIKSEVGAVVSTSELHNGSSEYKHTSGFTEENSKSEGTSLDSPALTGQRKMVVCMGKPASTSSDVMISKSSASDKVKSVDSKNSNLNIKPKAMSDSSSSVKKDRSQSDERQELLRKTAKEQSRSSVNFVSKTSHSSRSSHATVLKRTISDSKDSMPNSSSKPSSIQNGAVLSASSESAGSLPSQCPMPGQSKVSSSGVPVKVDKLSQMNSQPTAKVNHAPPMHPPATSNSPATLSDEEVF